MRGKELDSVERITFTYRNREEHEMGRLKGFAAILGVAALMVTGVACGNGSEPTSLNEEAPTQAPPTVGGKTPTAPIVSHGGAVKDYVSLVDNLRAVGATVDPAGTGSADYFAPQGQLLTVNGGRAETFEFASAEAADAAAEGVSASGDSISRVDSETGFGVASSILWEVPPHFYKAGKLIVLYVGCDGDVIDALQETMGPQFAGGAGVGVHGVSVVGHGQCPDQFPPAPAGTGMNAPDLRLTFEGVEYTGVEIVGALSPTGVCVHYNPLPAGTLLAQVKTCMNPIINMDDMEVVGTGTDHNPDGDASVEVYRLKAGESDFLGDASVYTFQPAPSDTWTRWTK